MPGNFQIDGEPGLGIPRDGFPLKGWKYLLSASVPIAGKDGVTVSTSEPLTHWPASFLASNETRQSSLIDVEQGLTGVSKKIRLLVAQGSSSALAQGVEPLSAKLSEFQLSK